MFPLKFIRENLALIEKNCQKRNFPFDSKNFLNQENERLKLLRLSEEKKALMNKTAKEIGVAKKSGEKLSEEKQAAMRNLGDEIKIIDEKLRATEKAMKDLAFSLPNLLNEEVPVGLSEENNQEIKKWGDIPQFAFSPLDHVAILEKNNWADFEKAAKITGARFAILQGEVVKLQRALISFFLEENSKRNYLEISPPSIVNHKALEGTGQLPKFKEDIFFLGEDFSHFGLIPTAEVPLTNLYREDIILEADLPFNFTAYTSCFRSEAGSAGRDTKGLIRLHEFAKVELVKIVHPENSETEHQKMVSDVENLLQNLKLPYRIVLLCSGDTGFSAKKCYDLEVWLPGQQAYREISSCSNCGNFQAHRMKTRFRKKDNSLDYVHTLNGSALPIGRTLVAILENYQKADGTITVPDVLKKYYF